jgi:hypothetical protein
LSFHAGDSRDSTVQLLPHQEAFVDAFFDPASKRVILLRADVGLGKTTALVALVSRLLRERPASKVLLLAPGALRLHFVEQLRSGGVPALSVDRYQFREMVDAANGPDLWPSGAVSVMSRDFARQEDIGQALGATQWDLLIVDEAQQFQGSLTGRVLRHIAEASDRIILATATSLGSDLLGEFPQGSVAMILWRRDQIVDSNGTPLDTMPRPIVRVIQFMVSPAEILLAETVAELVRLFNAGTTQQHLLAKSLLRSLKSSPAALEGSLARIREARNRAVHAMEPLDAMPDDELLDDDPGGYIDPSVMAEAGQIASRALDILETSGVDSKVASLVNLLDHIDTVRTSTRICVLVEYVATLFYVAAEIESRGLKGLVFHGGMPAEERQRTLSVFASDGGILVATRGVVSGSVALGEVTDLVFYDTPGSLAALQSILARVDRFGRQTQLNIHALVPSNDVAGGGETEFIGLLEEMTGNYYEEA